MTATAHLSPLEECFYSRMIDQYYAREAPLPKDIPALCRLVRAASAADKRAVVAVLREFFTDTPDGWRQKRCDEEIAAYLAKGSKAAASAFARWGKNGTEAMRSHSERNANAVRTHSEGNATSHNGRNANQNQNQNQNHKTQGEASEWIPTSEAPLPPGLDPATWAAWRSHLANLRKPMTPQGERLQLVRLAGHANPEEVVRRAIERGHRNLEPVGGWSDRKPESVHEQRAKTAREMHGSLIDEKPDQPTDITGESQRVA
jgi:uncharacterized protein YdaU (DUF1376 family)